MGPISLAPDPIAGFAWPGVEQPLKHRTTKRTSQRNNERTNERKNKIACNQHPRFPLNGSAAVLRTSMAGSLLFVCPELTLTIATRATGAPFGAILFATKKVKAEWALD